jgi:hypothetical protein
MPPAAGALFGALLCYNCILPYASYSFGYKIKFIVQNRRKNPINSFPNFWAICPIAWCAGEVGIAFSPLLPYNRRRAGEFEQHMMGQGPVMCFFI